MNKATVTRQNIGKHVLFMPAPEGAPGFYFHTGFGWAPCDMAQNSLVDNHAVDRVAAAPFFDEDAARGADAFGVFVLPGVMKR